MRPSTLPKPHTTASAAVASLLPAASPICVPCIPTSK